jgi:hypothetical protein
MQIKIKYLQKSIEKLAKICYNIKRFQPKGVFLMKNNVKNKKYKIIALAIIALAALLCLSACAGSSKAPDAKGELDGGLKWEYTASSNTLEINGDGAIPSYKSSSEVPWAAAFDSIEKIEIDDGVTKIGSYAFYGCANLEKTDIADSVTEIGDFAFAYCTAVEKIDVPQNITKIGNSAFEGCSKLTEVKLGEAVTSVGTRAFAFCGALKSAHVLGSADIKAETFYNCGALETVVFGASITSDKVSADAFKNTNFDYSKAQIAADPNTTVTVTIKYVYEDGTKAAEDKVFADLKIGDSYSVNTVEIDGYTADKLTVSGNAPAKDSVITVTYKQNEEATDTEAVTETEPVVEEEKNPVKDGIFLAVMVVLIAGLGVGAYLLMRSNKHNEEKARNQNKAKNRKK